MAICKRGDVYWFEFFKAATPLDQMTRERVEAYKEWRARQRRQRPVNAKAESSKKEQASPKAID